MDRRMTLSKNKKESYIIHDEVNDFIHTLYYDIINDNIIVFFNMERNVQYEQFRCIIKPNTFLDITSTNNYIKGITNLVLRESSPIMIRYSCNICYKSINISIFLSLDRLEPIYLKEDFKINAGSRCHDISVEYKNISRFYFYSKENNKQISYITNNMEDLINEIKCDVLQIKKEVNEIHNKYLNN